MKEYTFEGRNEEEALQNACAELGVLPEDLRYEVTHKKTSVLGFGRSQVRLLVRFRSDLTGAEEPVEEGAGVSDEASLAEGNQAVERGTRAPQAEEPRYADEGESDGALNSDIEQADDDDDDTPPSERGARAREVALRIIDGMGLSGSGRLSEDERSITLLLRTNDDNLVIGRGGVVLEAIQFLVNKIVNRFPEDRKFVVVDVNAYRARKQDSLERFAIDMCERVLSNGKAQRLNDLNPRERRFVHTIVSRYEELSSRSEGTGDQRVLLIEET